MKPLWMQHRGLVLGALTVLLSGASFAGVQLADGLRANAADCPEAPSCAPPPGTTTTTTIATIATKFSTPIRRQPPNARPTPARKLARKLARRIAHNVVVAPPTTRVTTPTRP
ncbi:MAG: hypothetical protein QOE62_1463, partial [Actinomycetota bacterium]|nr:hypothetical protein [Actinomycetota bacterium]